MRKLALASDFDGTIHFMFDEERFKAADRKAIAEFQKAGNLFGVCTGRSMRGITDVVVDEFLFDFYIFVSGALILDRDLKVIYKKTISRALTQEILEQYEAHVKLVIQANDTVYCFRNPRPLQVVIETLDDIPGEDIYGLSFATGSPEEANRIAAEVNGTYGHTVRAYANVHNVDIVHKECSKGQAVQIVKECMGLPFIAGIGDSHNDVPMLEMCDCSFTFTYSPESVQEKATYVVDSAAEAVKILMKGAEETRI